MILQATTAEWTHAVKIAYQQVREADGEPPEEHLS